MFLENNCRSMFVSIYVELSHLLEIVFFFSNVSTTPVVFVTLTACWYLDTQLEKLVSSQQLA